MVKKTGNGYVPPFVVTDEITSLEFLMGRSAFISVLPHNVCLC